MLTEARKRKPFVMVPHSVMDDEGLSHMDILVYMAVRRITGESPQGSCYASVATIGKLVRRAERQTRRSLQVLVDTKHLVETPNPGVLTGRAFTLPAGDAEPAPALQSPVSTPVTDGRPPLSRIAAPPVMGDQLPRSPMTPNTEGVKQSGTPSVGSPPADAPGPLLREGAAGHPPVPPPPLVVAEVIPGPEQVVAAFAVELVTTLEWGVSAATMEHAVAGIHQSSSGHTWDQIREAASWAMEQRRDHGMRVGNWTVIEARLTAMRKERDAAAEAQKRAEAEGRKARVAEARRKEMERAASRGYVPPPRMAPRPAESESPELVLQEVT